MHLKVVSFCAAAVALAAIPLTPARAVPAGPALAAHAAPAAIVQVRGGCGPGWHPVRGHYNRWGRWVPRHCVPNR